MALSNFLYILRNGLAQTFWIPSPPLTEDNLPDQSNRVFLITGGYTGVGEQVASILYSKNGTVWVAGRSESKAAAAFERLQSQHPNSSGKLQFLKVDFSDLSTIKPAVNEFLRRNECGKLHWLDNNAGVMVPPKGSKGAQGHELQFSTNIYGPFLFTKLLLPVLRDTAKAEKGTTGKVQSAPVRVSWAGSAATYLSRPHNGISWAADGKDLFGSFSDPQGAYAISKAANWYLAVEFGRRFGNNDGVLHNSYNPGNLSTELQRTAKDHMPGFVHSIISVLLFPAKFGAYTELYAGLSENISLTIPDDQGGWIVPWGRKSVMRADMLTESRRTESDAVGSRLWEWCEGIVKDFE